MRALPSKVVQNDRLTCAYPDDALFSVLLTNQSARLQGTS